MSCGLASFNYGPGQCSDERGRPLRCYFEFHVKQNNYLSAEHVVLTVYIVFKFIVQNQWCIDIRHAPRSGDFDMPSSNLLCFSTQPGHEVVGMSWIGALLISSCITLALLICYCILNWIIANVFQGYTYWLPWSIKQVPITSGHVLRQGNNVNCTKIMSGYLVRFFCACKDDWASFLKALRSLIASSHVVNLFLHWVANVLTLYSLQTEVKIIAANPNNWSLW